MKPEEAAENILVVPANTLASCTGGVLFTGFRNDIETFEKVLDPRQHSFKPRGEMEEDPTWKQIIPYTLVRFPRPIADMPSGDWFLSYQRSSDQAEARLAGKHSIGVGGHVTDTDVQFNPEETTEQMQFLLDYAGHEQSLIWRGMIRELSEEVNLRNVQGARIIGLLNEEATDVGKVHLGVVVLVDVASTTVDSNDPYVQNLQWMSVSSLQVQKDAYEGWSRICIDILGGLTN